MTYKSLFLIGATCFFSGIETIAQEQTLSASDVKTLGYNFGVANSEGLKNYISSELKVSSDNLKDVIKGIKEGATKKEDKAKDAYLKGLEIGKQIKQMDEELSKVVFADDSTKHLGVENILSGILDGLNNKSKISADSARTYFQNTIEPIAARNQEKKYAEVKAQNIKFLEDNKTKEGVVTLPSGVQYKVITAGNGPLPSENDQIKCHYEGKLIDGTIFDSSYRRDEPISLNMANLSVIEGWQIILPMMPYGSKWEVYIPEQLGYGARDMGTIKPYSTLIFTIELLNPEKETDSENE